MSLKVKPGVSLLGITPQWVFGVMVSDVVFAAHRYDCVVTGGADLGGHGHASIHYSGNAFDLRIKHTDRNLWQLIRDMIAENLGPEWDVILEASDRQVAEGRQHIHCEWQPKA